MGHRGKETTFELTTIERLEQQGDTHLLDLELERPDDEVALKDLLRTNMVARYPGLPALALDKAVSQISRLEGVAIVRSQHE